MVGLLTLDSKIYNYGGFLQEMALQDAIKMLGYDCEIIDYSISQELNTFSIKRGIKNISYDKIKKKIVKNKSNSLSEDATESIKIRKEAFDSYRSDKLVLSKKYSYLELHDETLNYDKLVCGSDQIWNPDYNIPSFFLNFGNNNCKKIIYAASIGRSKLSKHERKVYSLLLDNPDYISVREESAKKMISKITKKNVELVLDPTLLHSQEYWEDKANDSNMIFQNYIFCYFLNLTDEKIKEVNTFAKNNNMEIVIIPYLHNEDDDLSKKVNGIHVSNVNPADFLNLIRNANFVLTDSFHAVVFSIIFKKEFWCFGRNVGAYNMNSRLYTLLGYTDLQNRMIKPEVLNCISSKEHIEFNLETLEQKRKTSISFLKESLK